MQYNELKSHRLQFLDTRAVFFFTCFSTYDPYHVPFPSSNFVDGLEVESFGSDYLVMLC